MSWRANRVGFTLIEALAVVAIIALLVGLLFPAIHLVRESAQRRLAQQRAQAIVQAFKQYRSAYGMWPDQSNGSADITFSNNAPVLAALTNNPRGMVFFQDNELPVANDGFLDPWNRLYVIAVDWNGDGRADMTNSAPDGSFATNVNDTVAVLSWGPPDTTNVEQRVYSWDRK